MKSKVIPAQLGQKPSDCLKNSSFNFLEHERYHTLVEKGHVDVQSSLPATQNSKSYEKLDSPVQEQTEQQKNSEELASSKIEEFALSSERFEAGIYAPKRYITTCYFEPKQVPVWFSETMIVNIGSTKKKYYESIYHENRVYPSHWSETMSTLVPGPEGYVTLQSDVNIPITESEFHYMSLEPQQQIAAEAKI